MKTLFLLFFVTMFSFSGLAQTLSGEVYNRDTGEPVPYANIGIIGKNLGTASDENGRYSINLQGIGDTDTLGISCIGFEFRKISVGEIRNQALSGESVRTELSPRVYQLAEISIKPLKIKQYTLGNFCDPGSAYGNAFYSKELGTEIGVVMRIPKGRNKAFLKNFRFYVGEFSFTSFPVRLNVYTLVDRKPGENILHEPIFIDINSEGEYFINLEPYHLVLYDDFFVSLEYFRISDNADGKLIFCAVSQTDSGTSFYRYTSQGSWQREPFNNLGFSVVADCAK